MRIASPPAFATAVVALLLLLGAEPAAAQYQWRDKQGQVHLSDMPPPREIPDKDVIKRPSSSTSASTSASPPPSPRAAPAASPAIASSTSLPGKPPADPELEARRKRADEEARARAQTDAQRRSAEQAENCQRARQHLATLDSGQRLIRYDEKGDRLVVDDVARANEAQAARRAIADDCR